MAPRKLAAGNWKMNGDLMLVDQIIQALNVNSQIGCDVLLCPPAPLILPMKAAIGDGAILVGGQDCHAKPSGAHTGDISATLLKDVGADYVILGHSERRSDHGETDAMIAAKAVAAHQAGLTTIICVGETEAQRDAGEALAVVEAQVKASVPDCATAANTVIAYEPVWAIGTGKTPTTDQIAEVHAHLRQTLAGILNDAADMRLLYGGSVKAANAAEIFAVANVDGALVGGASLKAVDFAPIIAALSQA